MGEIRLAAANRVFGRFDIDILGGSGQAFDLAFFLGPFEFELPFLTGQLQPHDLDLADGVFGFVVRFQGLLPFLLGHVAGFERRSVR